MIGVMDRRTRLRLKSLPLPVGEGRGEGECAHIKTPSPCPLPKGEGFETKPSLPGGQRNIHAFVPCLIALLTGVASGTIPAPLFGQQSGGWTPVPVAQANGALVQMPLNQPASRHSHLSLALDTRWANNYGYRPVEVTIASSRPATADRLVTVRLHTGWNGLLDVEQDFELPLGSTSATTTIAVPQFQSSGQSMWWDVWVDGIKDNDLSLDADGAARMAGGGFGSASGITFLVIGPQTRALLAPNTYHFEILQLPTAEFPQRWIDYTCLDVVVLSSSELQALSQSNPAAFASIERWVRAGGQLWVGDVGAQFEQLADVSKRFRLSDSIHPAIKQGADSAADTASARDPLKNAWQPVRFRNGLREGQVVTFLDIATGENRVEREPEVIARLQNDPNFVTTDQRFESSEQDTARRWPRDSSEWFVEQRFGLGVVRAFRETTEVSEFSQRPQPTDPNAAIDPDARGRMPRSLSMAMRSADRWSSRHGMAPDDANGDFANLLVPGVGLAPVTEFRILITAFVIMIGPLNYWLLKRCRRLHLMVLTVPLAAALMTAALFAYATVSDGFGTTIRVHSFTSIDQRRGEAACWARLSYYSGLAPGSGLTLPADVAIYPINPSWNANRRDRNWHTERELVWEDGQAKLTRGWLRSRTSTQYLTVRSRHTPHRLDLAAGGGKLRATNKLSTPIDSLVVIDKDGKHWGGEHIANGAVTFLTPIDDVEAVRRFRQLVMTNEPQPPPALSSAESHYGVLQRRQARRLYGNRFGFQSGESKLSTSLMSEAVAELAGVSGGPALALPPRSYVAVTATGPEVETGMRGAVEEASFHVVVGQW
jgi:hypothetical protein